MEVNFQQLSAEAKFKILQEQLKVFEPIVLAPQTPPNLQPLPSFNTTFPSHATSLPVSSSQHEVITPSTSSLRWPESLSNDYSVTKVDTRGVPFIYIIAPGSHQPRPEDYGDGQAGPTCADPSGDPEAQVGFSQPEVPGQLHDCHQPADQFEMEVDVFEGQLTPEDIEFAITGF